MKKKIVTICLLAALAATALVGGSLAYFTDTDTDNNTFAMGNLQIELIEKQRNEDGSALENFENGKTLLPLVGNVQNDPKDKFGLTTAGNYVDKIVTVKNSGNAATGGEEAFVRVLVAVPSALIADGGASDNILHFNTGNKFVAAGNKAEGSENDVNADWSENWTAETREHYQVELAEVKDGDDVVIKAGKYNIYSYTYKKALAAGEETGSACIVGFYLDSRVDNEMDSEGKIYYTMNGTKIDYDLASGVTIPVYAQAVQADGFTDKNGDGSAADEAFAAANLTTNPWK